MTLRRWIFAIVLCLTGSAWGQEAIQFTQETLENGLQVIYVPLHQAPVVHVRLVYHVGSRDERPDRQGFAHMFEHMMFRGSAHVKPEEHMKLIGMVGGDCNASTFFDRTEYHETLPSNQLQMALWLEADRMASFKVSDSIYKTERQVVAEEWRMGRNRPYGTMLEDLFKIVFVGNNYRWSTIGNMQHLAAAPVNELQDFFNKYYLPNNALLVIAGDIQTDQAKGWVKEYFGWIPKGPTPDRTLPPEPEQTAERHSVSPQRVPLPEVVFGFKTPVWGSDDHYALTLLGTAMGDGASSRLDRLLVQGENPPCVSVGAEDFTLEDAGVFFVEAKVKQGRSPEEVTTALKKAIADVVEKGITEAELAKAKTQVRIALIHGRETAEQLADQVSDEAMYAGDGNRVNTELAKIEKVTLADVQAVAAKYLKPEKLSNLTIKPDPLGTAARAASAQAQQTKDAPVVAATQPITPRAVTFPANYPTSAPIAKAAPVPEFKKGTEMTVNGVKVVVMTDNRLPLVSWSLTMRRGSNSEPKEKKGLNSIVSEMLTHGTKEQTYGEFNNDLESRGISIGVSDGGDFTRLGGSSTTEQLEHGLERSRQVLLEPRWDETEFATVKDQEINNLIQSQESPGSVASHDLAEVLYKGSIFAYYATPETVKGITLDDVKKFYAEFYKPNDAVLILAGDVTAEKGKELAEKLLAGWEPAKELAAVDYTLPPPPSKRQIILVDRTDAPGVTIKMGVRGYDIHNEEKYAGSLAGQVLTGSGIDSRLMKYVRAEKGYVYGIGGYFVPGRHNGQFSVNTETRPDAAADTITATFHVLQGLRDANATEEELSESKLRVAGSMVMGMQTIDQQASTRTDGILNGYPIDYYDKYPARLAQVSGDEVKAVMNKYVNPQGFSIVVVAPAAADKGGLGNLGLVEVRPMPSMRKGATSQPSHELLK